MSTGVTNIIFDVARPKTGAIAKAMSGLRVPGPRLARALKRQTSSTPAVLVSRAGNCASGADFARTRSRRVWRVWPGALCGEPGPLSVCV